MKILKLRADGFGPLRGEYAFNADGVTLLVDDNERGKSSLMAAVTAGLYGLDGDRRTHRVITPLERWRPWDGGPFRLELDLEHQGERYTVIRDFDRNIAEVWNERGQELSHEFRDGDAIAVGRKLLGLDAVEFEKCALVRQGELDLVVEDEERMRRASTLQARLEEAADSRGGDASAIEAIQALDQAMAQYTCPELPSTVRVETAIQRLRTGLEALEVELNALEHDLERVRQPLDDLAGLDDEDRALRLQRTGLEGALRAQRAAVARRRLEEDQALGIEIERLSAEAEAAAGTRDVPASAEAELRDLLGRLEAARQKLAEFDTRAREAAEEDARRSAEIEALGPYENSTHADADALAARAAEIRQLDDQHELLLERIGEHHAELAEHGLPQERVMDLARRFEALEDEDLYLLRSQPHLSNVFQRSYNAAEADRNESTEILHEIARRRRGRVIPGWILLALGSTTIGAGIAALALRIGPPWHLLAAAGALLVVLGMAMLLWGNLSRRQEREEQLDRLSEADNQLEQLSRQRSENEERLASVAREIGCEDSASLQREWTDYGRLLELGGEVRPLQLQIADVERQRVLLVDAVRPTLEVAGGGPCEPDHLELTAACIRKRIDQARQLAEFRKGNGWIEMQRMTAQTSVAELEQSAVEVLRSAGIARDPQRTWADEVEALAQRARETAHRARLTRERIPELQARRLDPQTIEDLRAQIAAAPATPAAAAPAARTPAAIESEIAAVGRRIEEILHRRAELRPKVDEVLRRYHATHPVKSAERDAWERALERALRYQEAVALARETLEQAAHDTHQRWAEFLNRRVGEILQALGTHVGSLRFGEDLDFAACLSDRTPVPRGRALMQLSAGARDQLHFAVRLAISEFLSRGAGSLPLMVDDCFATSDDPRARAGMRFLIEQYAQQHQIIFTTCHRQRYAEFAALDPALYAERVLWTDLGTGAGARR